MKLSNQETNEAALYGSFQNFMEKNRDRIFRFWVYRRMFTPLEIERKYMDQEVYEDTYCHTGIIREAIILTILPIPQPDGFLRKTAKCLRLLSKCKVYSQNYLRTSQILPFKNQHFRIIGDRKSRQKNGKRGLFRLPVTVLS